MNQIERMGFSTLRNWRLIEVGVGSYVVTGQVMGDERFKGGEVITTALVRSINIKDGLLATINTDYNLIEPADGTTPLGKATV